MAPELKIARQRMSVLELSAKLKNVSEACRRRGITRTQFYEYKKRFETFGLEGLVDLPPIPKSHPQTTGLTPIFSATENVSISPAGDTDETEELHRRADHSCPARG